MKRNSFDVNRKIALAYVQGEQLKGYFLAKARLVVIILSGAMLFLGVTMLFGNLQFKLTTEFLVQILGVLPVALVAGLLALVIEGGTIFCSAVYRETKEKTTRELDALNKVAHKYKSDEIKRRRNKIKKGLTIPTVLLIVFVSFSAMGAEIFWQKIMGDNAWYFHVIGAILGLVCSSFLILLEMRHETVERIIERSVSSSAIIQMALEQSARAQIYEAQHEAQREYLDSPEAYETIDVVQTRRLQNILAETLSTGQSNVTVEQIRRELDKQKIERAAADAYLATKDENVLQLNPPTSTEPLKLQRKSTKRKEVEKLVGKYGLSRIQQDVDKYVNESSMDKRTFVTHLTDIASGQ